MDVERTKRFVGVDEAATFLGLSVSTIRRRIADGTLPTLQPGGRRKKILVDIGSLTAITAAGPPELARLAVPLETNVTAVPAPTRRHGPPPRWRR
jgi:excisionase family DNA binding protein